ncbi:MAG: tRNA (guanosine(37)-N1)-methyltransferase TrmD [Oscillospiraceae bacterium]|jgi:tRNA (guanine37-N1)-methyltransferase|nr:tRNA (guanosine(37)-N1)-methyltransferase TrmD [Oscillospiraceae bacterium]
MMKTVRIDIATLFPEMCDVVLSESIVGMAKSKGIIEVHTHNIRDYAKGCYRKVDDYPYGGGFGMLLLAEPIYQCIRSIKDSLAGVSAIVLYMSPKGERLTQRKVFELARVPNIIILAGHYEGVDQRVLDLVVDEEISVGDYVLTGGELPALTLVDAISRCLPGVLSDEECYINESHSNNMLEYPQYTRPEVWRGLRVPRVLLSGDHAGIQSWQEEAALKITKEKRPDLLGEMEKMVNKKGG